MTDDDRRWISAVDEIYRPPPMDAGRRAAFHARLEARLERSHALRLAALVPASAIAAAAALWLALPRTHEPSLGAPALYAFVDPSLYAEDAGDTGEYLPDDYRALAVMLEADAEEQ